MVEASGDVVRALPAPTKISNEVAAEVALKGETGDAAAVGFKLDAAGKVIPDKIEQNALKLGIDEGRIGTIKAASPGTRSRMLEMVEVVEKGQKNAKFRDLNRPGNVVGQAVEERLSIVRKANQDAGKRVDKAARALKGQQVDYTPAINEFMGDLGRHGIRFDPGSGKLDFSESSLEGLKEAQGIVRRMVTRLHSTNTPPDAHDVHRAKRFIDAQVVYGKTQGGLSGEMVHILKKLRHGLDSALDEAFPAYDEANTAYSETVRVLDDIQGMAGARVDLLAENSDRALGAMSRKILSNYATGTPMLNTFNDLDDLAGKYGPGVADDIVELAGFEAELRRLFPTVAPPNSLQGITWG